MAEHAAVLPPIDGHRPFDVVTSLARRHAFSCERGVFFTQTLECREQHLGVYSEFESWDDLLFRRHGIRCRRESECALDNVMIGGLVINGDVANNVIQRALGPSLIPYGIPNALPNPTLELHNGEGTLIGYNDNWKDNAVQASKIAVSGVAPTNLLESATAVTLPPGSYTAIVRGRYNGNGVALFEVYDIR